MYEYIIIMLTCRNNFISDSDVFCTVNNNNNNNNNTKCDTKYKSDPSHSGPKQQSVHIMKTWSFFIIGSSILSLLPVNKYFILTISIVQSVL
jgi:hypothetical protein